MLHRMKITVSTVVHAPLEVVWNAWTNPAAIVVWNAASDDWHTTRAEVDLRVGGRFSSRMEAKDGSMGFDFEGIYSVVVAPRRLAYGMGDGRSCLVEFVPLEGTQAGSVSVTETFDAEESTPPDLQRQGWQAILDRFAQFVHEQR
jgi:uncharacterized protein YndB with AHSA1/START domain